MCVFLPIPRNFSLLPATKHKREKKEREMKKLIVIRHGERIDEVDRNSWSRYCHETYRTERQREERGEGPHYLSRFYDPYLTKEGCEQAQEVADKIVEEIEGEEIPVIYCSKLVRAVQTAYYIALRLSKPIVVSKGFAMTSAAVEEVGEQFQFVTIDEIRELCPGVEWIDGDVSEEHAIPSSVWDDSIQYAIRNHTFSLIVAHRESIRYLSGIRMKLPYCAYGVFHIPNLDDSPQFHQIKINRLMQRDGQQMEIISKPPK
jgi:broad specificity phosphatase PhoE